jgi:dihydroorotase-like cyclic amidohydrolase
MPADPFVSAWLPNTELTNLDPEECKDFSEKGKTKSLIQAYHVAAEGNDLEHFKAMLLDHQKAMQEDQERRDARETAKAEKAERAEKKKRKSEAAEEDEDVDMEDAEEEGKSEPKKSSKKRKKEVESDGEDEKVSSGIQTRAAR